MPLVDARHVVVEIPAFRLDAVDHGGHVRGDTRHKPGIFNPLKEIANLVDLAALEEVVGHLAVMGDADRSGFDQRGDVLRIGLDHHELHRAALVDVAAIQVAIARSRLPTRNAHFLATAQRFEDSLGGKIAFHLAIDEIGKMRAAVERVRAADEPGDAVLTEGDLRKLTFLGRRGQPFAGVLGRHQ